MTIAPTRPAITDEQWSDLMRVRATQPHAVASAYRSRRRPPRLLSEKDTLFLVAADHPARGALATGGDRLAMADRRSLLSRLVEALSHTDVDGVLGTPDVIEELLLLGALEGKVVIGSMNRGGLDGAVWTMDDRFTGYDAASIARYGLDGGKMLLRIDHNDERTARTIEACADAVTDLAEEKLIALVEPFVSHRIDGRLANDLSVEAATTAVTIASGLGATSAYTWLKIPVIGDGGDAMAAVLGATTLPTLLLGGEIAVDQDRTYERWARALHHPTVRGLVVGRALLYPPDGDVARAVDTAARLL